MRANFFQQFKSSRSMLKALLFGSFFFGGVWNQYSHNSFFNRNLQCLTTAINEITYTNYPANGPIEDRYNIVYLKKIKGGLFLSILDGHGGDMLSEFANKNLANYIDEAFDKNKSKFNTAREAIVESILNGFERIENEFKEKAIKMYAEGNGKLATVGACALVTIIHDDVLYVANLGDSKARLIRLDQKDNSFYSEKLMHRHNAEKNREKQLLYSKFPDKDIVVCKRNDGTVCYVKGRLQPTRSFGDFHLKLKEFNQSSGSMFKRPIQDFNGPYISSQPEITVYPIDYNTDKYLVIASDGLGDFVNSKQVVSIISSKLKENKEPKASDLLDKVLENASSEAGMTVNQLKDVPLGKRRSLHDDTTIILLKLIK